MFVSSFPSFYPECESVGRSQGTLSYLVLSKSVSDSKSFVQQKHTLQLVTVFLHVHRQKKTLPNQSFGSIGKLEANVHFWMAYLCKLSTFVSNL